MHPPPAPFETPGEILLGPITVKSLQPHFSEPGTMPATWAELRGSLAALLDWLESAPSVDKDMKCVPDVFERWQGLAADLPPLPPNDAERSELLG